MQMLQQDLRPGTWRLFCIWAGIGLQSFGGGASTIFLIQRTFIEKYHWLSMEEFLHLWNLCLFAPGINLIAITILIGRKLGGAWGIISSLAGMLLPSATITCLLTAGFTHIEHLPAVQAVLSGVIPATAGIMFLVSLRFMQPQIKIARQEGPVSLATSIIVILACTLAILLLRVSVFVILPTVALLGIVLFTRPLRLKREES